jgi:predicted enzyme related to lactoylglutathione lyase
LQPRAFLDGQETGYTDLLYSGSIDLVCTVFQPAGAKAFFNVPLIELSEQNVAVDDLEDPQLIELGNRLFDTADIQTSVLLIEQFLFKRLRTPAAHNLRRINADNGQSPGAISLAKNFRPSKDGVLISLHVDDMEKALSAVEVNGGEIIRPKTKLEAGGCGYFALFTDSEGNRLGLYSDK